MGIILSPIGIGLTNPGAPEYVLLTYVYKTKKMSKEVLMMRVDIRQQFIENHTMVHLTFNSKKVHTNLFSMSA